MPDRMPDHAGRPAPYLASPASATPLCGEDRVQAAGLEATAPPIATAIPSVPPPSAPALPPILDQIRRHGPLRFDHFLTLALYHPELGYYARHARPLGRRGDFFTSVSVGPVFAQLLARRIHAWWLDAGQPPRWRMLETGAHDATLALDLHAAFATIPGLPPPDFTIVEPLPSLRNLQRSRLATTGIRVLPDHSPLAADPIPGFVLANEVLDAIPFRLAVRRQNHWLERFVIEAPPPNCLSFVDFPLAPGYLPEAPFPDGYQAEFRDGFPDFLRPLRDSIAHGTLLFLDYGFERHELLDPARITGTLRTFHHHQAGEDPLLHPGDLDITAHVDFTTVAQAALDLHLHPSPLESQASCLIRHSRDWLESLASLPTPARQSAIRQFHTLTHPAHLGLRFQALQVSKIFRVAKRTPAP